MNTVKHQIIESYVQAFKNNISAQFIFINHQGLFGISSQREQSSNGKVKFINRYTDDISLEIEKFIDSNPYVSLALDSKI